MKNKIIVMSVGGSLIVPNEIDTDFLEKFKLFIKKQTDKGWRFVIVAGGGWTAREYQKAAKKIGNPTEFDLDILGIHGTRINAFLLKTLFTDIAHQEVILNPSGKISFSEKILIAAEENPGADTTSDYGAVKMAEYIGTDKIINLTNIDYVYDKNPKEYSDAKPIKKMTWLEFFNVLPKDWESGGHAPFGPKASKEANDKNLEVIIINGHKLDELEKCLNGDDFIGTIIKN
jgi:uridylate kinase